MPNDTQSTTGQNWIHTGPLPLKFMFMPRTGGTWRRMRSGLLARDVGLHAASDGVLSNIHLRANGKPGQRGGWYSDDIDFYYLHVMDGEVKLQTDKGDTIVLKRGDSLVMPAFNLRQDVFAYSADFEAMEFTSRGALELIETNERRIGHEPGPLSTEGQIISRDVPESYVTGDGPRKFFSYRNLGATQSTGGRIHIHVVGIVDTPPGGTGWHTHSMDQFWTPFTGFLDIAVEGFGKVRLRRGDAMAIPVGLRHNVTEFSLDYTTNEVCIPTDYLTTPAPTP